jgi:carbon-monoxide dehydrogenase medium subunit
VKPSPFSYSRAESTDEAVAQLAQHGDDANLLAGGQSLIPMLALRLARPSALIDVSRIGDLRYAVRAGDELRIGALTRHRELLSHDLGAGYDVLRRVVPLVGHEPIRTRGTLGGSIAHADPAAEWPLVAVLLDAELVVIGPSGRSRRVAARDFLQGYFTTDLDYDEMLVELRFPRPWPGAAIHEHARRHGDFALVSAAAAVDVDADGRCREARVALGAVSDVPVRIDAAERALEGTRLDDSSIADVATLTVETIDPPDDMHASAAHRRRLAAALVKRALREAHQRATG